MKFHQLNPTRGSFYLPLPDWIANNKAVINPKNKEDEECFKWAAIAVLHYEKIGNNPQRISKLRRFEGNYNWGGFPVTINKIDIFELINDVSMNVLAIEGEKRSSTFSESLSVMAKERPIFF